MIWKIKLNLLILLLVLNVAVIGTACSKQALFADIPEDIMVLYSNYMEAAKKGTAEAEPYSYFVNENERNAFLANTEWRLEKYELLNAEKLTENLYVFTSDVSTLTEGKDQVYYFVAYFQDQWNFVANVNALPDELKETIDITSYTYDSDTVPYESVIAF